jgi:hypothetical protein
MGASECQQEATNSKTDLAVRSKLLILNDLVPKKGLGRRSQVFPRKMLKLRF